MANIQKLSTHIHPIEHFFSCSPIRHACSERSIKYSTIKKFLDLTRQVPIYCFTSRKFLHRVKNTSSHQELRDRPLQLYRHRLRGRRLPTQSNHCSVRLEFSILRFFPSDRERFTVQCMNLFFPPQCVYRYESM